MTENDLDGGALTAQAAEAAQTVLRDEPRAYALDYDDAQWWPAPPDRTRWALALAALCAAAAALLVAATVGVQILRGANVPVVTVTKPTVTVTEPTRTVTLTEPDQDTAFLMELQQRTAGTVPAGSAINNAHWTCYALEAGRSMDEIVQSFVETAINRDDPDGVRQFARALVSLAVKHYCPEYAR